jgi:hypothetical protein
MSEPFSRLKAAWTPRLRGQVRHGLRVAVAVGAAFGISSWALHLPQGYWAVISALLVVQTSIGGTISASIDRLVGTMVGAVFGGIAAFVRPETPWGEFAALVLCAGPLTIVAARWPSLRIAPVTSIIMIVGNTTHAGTVLFVRDRVFEIGIGSLVGVLTTMLVFPAPARDAVALRVAGTLSDLSQLLQLLAQHIEDDAPPHEPTLPVHDKIRADLAAVEAAVTEADRESQVRLSGGRRVSPAIPRTLWRLRNDAVMIGRVTDHAWTGEVAARLHPAAVAMLRAQAWTLSAWAAAMRDGRTAEKPTLDPETAAFRQAFEHLDESAVTRSLPFETLGQIFGLAYAFEAFNRNLDDLGARLREFHKPPEG